MTLEDIVRTGPLLILAGLTTAWIAEAVRRADAQRSLRPSGRVGA